MTSAAILGEAGLYMVGVGCGEESVAVTINAVNPIYIEPHRIGRQMTLFAIGSPVSSHKGKPALIMDFIDI